MTRKSLKPLVLSVLLAGGTALSVATGFALSGSENNSQANQNPPLNVQVDSNPITRDVKEGTGFAPIVKKVAPSVVKIFVTIKGSSNQLSSSELDFFRRFFGPDGANPLDSGRSQSPAEHGLGSGVIVSPDGYIMTNNHVVGNADTIQITLMDKREFTAKVVGKDAKTDLALIKIDTKDSLPYATLGNSDATEVGDWVVAIGNPFGFSLTVTAGIVSAKGRALGGNYDEFIQTDASINPGNSGGPLFDTQGRMVGINSAIYSSTGNNAGIGFAIPVDLAKSVMDQLREHGRVIRGWLGVRVQEVTPELAKSFGLPAPEGALVAGVEKDTPA